MFSSTTLRVGMVTLLVLGCSGDDFTPTVDNVAGSYDATVFTITEGTETTDLLDEGSSLSLELDSDGTTTGQLFVPDGGDGGGDLDESLEGNWALTGSTVTFSQDADTFLRDLDFTATENELRGVMTEGDLTLTVVLTK